MSTYFYCVMTKLRLIKISLIVKKLINVEINIENKNKKHYERKMYSLIILYFPFAFLDNI